MHAMRKTHHIAAVVLAAAALTITACSTGGDFADAVRGNEEDLYLQTLTEELGFPESDRAELVELGQNACTHLRDGGNMISAGFRVVDASNGKYDASEAGSIVGASLATYCVDYAQQLKQQMQDAPGE